MAEIKSLTAELAEDAERKTERSEVSPPEDAGQVRRGITVFPLLLFSSAFFSAVSAVKLFSWADGSWLAETVLSRHPILDGRCHLGYDRIMMAEGHGRPSRPAVRPGCDKEM